MADGKLTLTERDRKLGELATARRIDMAGQRFGRLIVLEIDRSHRKDPSAYWKCLCDCGEVKIVRGSDLRAGKQQSCGCYIRNEFNQKRTIDLTGKVFSRLTVIARAPSERKGVFWHCLCSCGNTAIVNGHLMKMGYTRSCGCLASEAKQKNNLTHGRSKTTTYRSWCAMITRCTNPKVEGYKNYGGRGIVIAERWRDFSNFLADMGERPNGHSLERRLNDGPYSPENCVWATRIQQQRNTRQNVRLTIDGVTKTLVEWSEEAPNTPYSTLTWRWQRGWPPKEIVFGRT